MKNKRILKTASKTALSKGNTSSIMNKWQLAAIGKTVLSMLLVVLMVTMLLSDAVTGIYSALAFDEQTEVVETVESAAATTSGSNGAEQAPSGGGVY